MSEKEAEDDISKNGDGDRECEADKTNVQHSADGSIIYWNVIDDLGFADGQDQHNSILHPVPERVYQGDHETLAFSLTPNAFKTKPAAPSVTPDDLDNIESTLSNVDLDMSRISFSPASVSWLNSTLAGSGGSSDNLALLGSPNHPLISPGTLQPISIPRVTSSGAIDWKMVGETQGTSSEYPKWRSIPQFNPYSQQHNNAVAGAEGAAGITHQRVVAPTGEESDNDTNPAIVVPGLASAISQSLQERVASITNTVGALIGRQTAAKSAATYAPAISEHQLGLSGGPLPTGLPPTHLGPPSIGEAVGGVESTKRKAIISPEYVQYAYKPSPDDELNNTIPKTEDSTSTPTIEVKGKRPSKKSVSDKVCCRCTGGCRNARCNCVAAGKVCGTNCKCTGCRNPFLPLLERNVSLEALHDDDCFMQNLSKIKDMATKLDSKITMPCCGSQIKLCDVLPTHRCQDCNASLTYSWCNGKLCQDDKKPRSHCSKCKRCGDHRNKHCPFCNRCYFAGVAETFKCSCQDPNSTSDSAEGLVKKTAGSTVSRAAPSLITPSMRKQSGTNTSNTGGLSMHEGLSLPRMDDCELSYVMSQTISTVSQTQNSIELLEQNVSKRIESETDVQENASEDSASCPVQ